MTEVISVSDCLKIMHSGQIFTAQCVTFDRTRRTGGEIFDIIEGVLVQPDEADRPDRPETKTEKTVRAIQKRGPRHAEHYTRNIRLCSAGTPTSVIKKIHPPLLTEFNGKIVVP